MSVLNLRINFKESIYWLCGFLIAFPLFSTTHAYHTWLGMEYWNKPILAMLLMAFILCFLLKKVERKISVGALVYASLYLLFLMSTEIPIRAYDSATYPIRYLIIISPLAFILLNKEIIKKTYLALYYIFLFIALLSLINLSLYAAGIIKPSARIWVEHAEFYRSGFDIFPFAPVLANQYIESFVNFYRNNGWYYEPGHFAIHLALILALQPKPFNGIKNLIYVFTIITTLSGSGLAMLAMLYVFHNYKSLGYQLLLLMLVLCLVFLYYINNDFSLIVDKFVLEKFVGTETLDNRRRFDGPSLFEIPFEQLLIGFGRIYIDIHNWQLSDFTSHIYRFGLLSFIFYISSISLLLIYAIKSHYKLFSIMLCFVVFIYLHRFFLAFRTETFYLIWIAYVFSHQFNDFKSDR